MPDTDDDSATVTWGSADFVAAEEMHRFRLGALLRHCPPLVQVWFHDGPVRHAEFSRDGRRRELMLARAADDRQPAILVPE